MEQFLRDTAVQVVGGLILVGMPLLVRRIYNAYRSDAFHKPSPCLPLQNFELTNTQDSIDRLAEFGARRILHRALRREIDKHDRNA